jgi:hypothetical protein
MPGMIPFSRIVQLQPRSVEVRDVAMSPLLCTPLSRSGRFLVKCVEKPTDSTN